MTLCNGGLCCLYFRGEELGGLDGSQEMLGLRDGKGDKDELGVQGPKRVETKLGCFGPKCDLGTHGIPEMPAVDGRT